MARHTPVRETRIAPTVQDYEGALRFWRDALGLPVAEEWKGRESPGAHLSFTVLDVGERRRPWRQ